MSYASQHRAPSDQSDKVTIDRNFVRDEAREAVRQFFRPITAPFETREVGSERDKDQKR